MKPSGPGLLFVGSILITDSILFLVSGLFIFSISSWFSLGRLYPSKNLSISSRLSILLALLTVVPCDPLYFCGVHCNFFFYISNYIDMSPLPFSS